MMRTGQFFFAATIVISATGLAGNCSLWDILMPSAYAQTASTPGDLSKLRRIAQDAAGLIDKRELRAAKARIEDLETALDKAGPKLKANKSSAVDWYAVDYAMDQALLALRASKPDADACSRAVAELLGAFDKSDGAQR